MSDHKFVLRDDDETTIIFLPELFATVMEGSTMLPTLQYRAYQMHEQDDGEKRDSGVEPDKIIVCNALLMEVPPPPLYSFAGSHEMNSDYFTDTKYVQT